MSEVLHANIFFVITSISVVVASILICIALYQVIKILRMVRRIIERIDAGSELIAEDVEQFRSFVRKGSLVSQIISFFVGQRAGSRRVKKNQSVNYNEE